MEYFCQHWLGLINRIIEILNETWYKWDKWKGNNWNKQLCFKNLRKWAASRQSENVNGKTILTRKAFFFFKQMFLGLRGKSTTILTFSDMVHKWLQWMLAENWRWNNSVIIPGNLPWRFQNWKQCQKDLILGLFQFSALYNGRIMPHFWKLFSTDSIQKW